MPAKTFNVGLLLYFILQKSQLPFLPFIDPVLKLCIYCESSGRSRGGPPPYCYTKLLHKGLKKIFWTPPPPPPLCLSHDLDDQAPPLSEGLDLPLGIYAFWIQNSRFEYSWQRNAP